MKTITHTDFNENFGTLFKKLFIDHDVVKVILEDGSSFVVMPQKEYEVLKSSNQANHSKTPTKQKPGKNIFKKLKPHNTIIGDPADLVDLKVYEWTEEKNL